MSFNDVVSLSSCNTIEEGEWNQPRHQQLHCGRSWRRAAATVVKCDDWRLFQDLGCAFVPGRIANAAQEAS